MLTIYSGTDPYRVLLKKKELMGDGYTLVNGIDSNLVESAYGASLFGDVRCIVLCQKTDDLDRADVKALMDSPHTFALFPKKEGSGPVSKLLAKAQKVTLDKMSVIELAHYVAGQAEKKGVRIDKAAWHELMRRTAYEEDESCDLGCVQTELDKLFSIGQDITQELVEAQVAENPQVKVFSFADAVASCQAEQAMAQADALTRRRDFDALMTIGLLEKKYRTAYIAALFDGNTAKKADAIGVPAKSLVLMPQDQAVKGLGLIAEAKKEIKRGGAQATVFLTTVYSLSHLSERR